MTRPALLWPAEAGTAACRHRVGRADRVNVREPSFGARARQVDEAGARRRDRTQCEVDAMVFRNHGFAFGRAVALCVLVAAPAAGQSAAGATADSAAEPAGWGFTSALGQGGTGGDFGKTAHRAHQRGVQLLPPLAGAWRYGAGVAYGSFKMKEPYQDEPEWGSIDTYLFGTRMLRTQGSVRPYVQVRGGLARLHPRSFLFEVQPPPEDLQPGESTTKAANGFMVGVVPGLELRLSRAAFLDASVMVKYFKVDDYDLSPVGPAPDGLGDRVGGADRRDLVPERRPARRERPERRARRLGRARGATAGRRARCSRSTTSRRSSTEYVRDVNFSQISPRSWWHNIDEGFTYDDNQFKTNQWTHPFNGAAYYNSSRAHGLGLLAVDGVRDSRAPSTGSAAARRTRCRSTTCSPPPSAASRSARRSTACRSEILNNQSRGMGRFWREFGGFFVDPIRGFNRLVSGDAKSTSDNPDDPMDWRPQGGRTMVATGVRSIGEGSSITNNTKSYATILLNHSYGDVFENTRSKPFDYMDFVAEINFGEKVGLGNVQIRGDLASWPLGGPGSEPRVRRSSSTSTT